ncbi:MAG: flavoprotein [Phycisphaerae bacterium]|jgi:phosphopantothenoylcysteine decarboxylase/phosphopantothenate--cysteine ligase
MRLEGKTILLGITGGVAAYKTAELASRLRKEGARLRTIMTASACELITPKLIEAVSAGPVFTSLWTQPENYKIGHIELLDGADIVVVAPATANIIGKFACGIADDLLSTTLCAGWHKKMLFAPAMNSGMWTNPATQRNIALLKELGVSIIGPAEGHLACGVSDVGRMSEAAEIAERVISICAQRSV